MSSNPKLVAIEARRQILIEAAASQRVALAQDIQPWRAPLALADHGIRVLQIVRHHPQYLLGAVALFAIVRPRRVGNWLQRGWVGWQLVQRLRAR